MKRFVFYPLICLVLMQADCKKKQKVEINDCDTIGNYYENGEHYIKRDMVTEDGVIDYNKMIDSYKGRKTACNPLNDQ